LNSGISLYKSLREVFIYLSIFWGSLQAMRPYFISSSKSATKMRLCLDSSFAREGKGEIFGVPTQEKSNKKLGWQKFG
jgi:hypothetical protein